MCGCQRSHHKIIHIGIIGRFYKRCFGERKNVMWNFSILFSSLGIYRVLRAVWRRFLRKPNVCELNSATAGLIQKWITIVRRFVMNDIIGHGKVVNEVTSMLAVVHYHSVAVLIAYNARVMRRKGSNLIIRSFNIHAQCAISFFNRSCV